MKKLIAFTFILLNALIINAQSTDSSLTKSQNKDVDYYMMKNNALIHFLATGEAETIIASATLADGVTVTGSGEVVNRDGSKRKLNNGECIDAHGVTRSCESLDAGVKMKVKGKDQK